MSVNDKPRSREPRGRIWRTTRGLVGALWPTQRLILTREGFIYFLIGVSLLSAGIWQQVNLILLVFTLSAGPFLASIFGGRTMLRRLDVLRRVPAYVFSGDPLVIDYTLENDRRWFPALALFIEDSVIPLDRSVSGTATVMPRVFFPRVAGRDRARIHWQCGSPKRGRYQFRDLDLGTRSPFGLVEHRVTIAIPDQILVYPKIGHLNRRWFQMQRQATENRSGQRHDRSAQQVEYHGLRGYRPGDSPRWIHWRTSARRGELMVKEFEQQNEQDLAILIDPWLPRTKAAAEQREGLEQAISFAATLCLESCRHLGRRLILGWTGAAPGVRQGPASVKLLHELLEQLATMRPVSEGGLAELFDVMPPAALREALLVIISTRPLNLIEEAERSSRFSGTSARSLLGRVLTFNSTQGDLALVFQFGEDSARDFLQQRLSSAIQERLSTEETRRRGLSADEADAPGGARPTRSQLVNSYLVYRASFYMMLFVATMALSGDNPEGQYAKLLSLVVAVAAVVAFLTVDRPGQWALSRRVANVLAVGTLGLLYFEYRLDDTQRIPALAHWLVYLQLIKFFLPKTAEDDWFLFLLGLTQILIGSVINQSDEVGGWLFLWAMLAVWVLGQFFLQREARRFSPAQRVSPTSGFREPADAAAPAPDPYFGLFDLHFAIATVRIMVTTLALGGLIFLVLPRQPGATRSQPGAPLAKHLTGFDEEVQLGQLGEILENDSVVMTVELFDEDGKAFRPIEDPLWRGVTMFKYEGGRWTRQARPTQAVVGFREDRRPRKLIHQKIKLEPIDSSTLFGIRPILKAGSIQPFVPSLSTNDGTLFRLDSLGGEYDYEVISDFDSSASQPEESPPGDYGSLREPLKSHLRAIAEPVVANIVADGREGTEARARALMTYLRDSGQFTYTLQMDVVDRKLDPVEDFLVKRKEGHCEYFASALALLLRSIGIQARIVNGFKGGDWNELTSTLNVRQKHAHSWVEAYLGLGTDGPATPIWITLDPTPGEQRKRSIAEVGGLAGRFRPLTDLTRHIWVFYVVGYNGERQDRLIYQPMLMLIREVRDRYVMMGQQLRRWFARLFHFQSIGAFFSVRGFLVTFIVSTMAAGLAMVVIRMVKRLLGWLHGPPLDTTSRAAGIIFYRRLAQMLAEKDLERTPAETQSEFAVRAHKFLTGQWPVTDPVADVPQQVVEAFYRVRFGHLELEPASLQELDARLDLLEARLKSP